jgi:excisionase family DNA binding protein
MGANAASFEDVVEGAVGRAVRSELSRLRQEVAALRRSLPPALGSMKDAARVTGLSLTTIKKRVAAGQIAHRRVGGRVLIDLASLHPVTDDDLDGEEI